MRNLNEEARFVPSNPVLPHLTPIELNYINNNPPAFLMWSFAQTHLKEGVLGKITHGKLNSLQDVLEAVIYRKDWEAEVAACYHTLSRMRYIEAGKSLHKGIIHISFYDSTRPLRVGMRIDHPGAPPIHIYLIVKQPIIGRKNKSHQAGVIRINTSDVHVLEKLAQGEKVDGISCSPELANLAFLAMSTPLPKNVERYILPPNMFG